MRLDRSMGVVYLGRERVRIGGERVIAGMRAKLDRLDHECCFTLLICFLSSCIKFREALGKLLCNLAPSRLYVCKNIITRRKSAQLQNCIKMSSALTPYLINVAAGKTPNLIFLTSEQLRSDLYTKNSKPLRQLLTYFTLSVFILFILVKSQIVTQKENSDKVGIFSVCAPPPPPPVRLAPPIYRARVITW